MENFIEDCLNAHNHYRAIHGSPPLQINPKLNDYANVWATYLAKKGDTSRRKTQAYGENVYIVYKDDVGRLGPVVEAVDSWYQENKFYEYGEAQPANVKATRHFTQLVWKGSAFMGLGMVTSPIGQIYIVCNYDPPGNVENEFAENVLPPVDQEQKEEDAAEDPSKSQKLRIEHLEPKMDIVESMHRIYAVPSEKLRVWSVWLSQIGNEADGWQKWLRAHIDLTLRMAARLKELEDADGKPRRLKSEMGEQVRRIFAYEEDAITDDGIEYPRGVKDFYDIEQVLANIVSGEPMEESAEDSPEADAEETAEAPGDVTEVASESAVSANVNEEEEEEDMITEGEEESGMEEEEDQRLAGGADETEEETTDGEEIAEDIAMDEEETEETEETVEKEDKDEAEAMGDEEGKEEIDDEADETSNYLKEWPLGTQWEPFGIQEEEEPSDIIEPLEMPQNIEELKNLIRDFTNAATIYRSYYKHWKETGEQAIKEIAGRTVMPTAKLRGILDENDLAASLRACLGYPKDAFRKSDICFAPPGKIARLMAMSERVGTVEFIKEMARADEDIPYFFYLTAEPDIEIAIKHDDEEVIPTDPEIEVISSNYGHLRFNLADKPGKGRKCSIGNG